MKNINEWKKKDIKYVFTDIDDTLTQEGLILEEAYSALWKLKNKNIKVIPITGRPAGWCEMIARTWPIDGVIGENGGFYFRYHNKKMVRHFINTESQRQQNQKKLNVIKTEVLKQVPGAAIASDQFCRMMDLAIDFCEDVPPLTENAINQIVSLFEKHGATAKVSSIHVNGWFGKYNKLSMCRTFMEKEFQTSIDDLQENIVFFGDSPNDEPLFGFFNNSIGVSNLLEFIHRLNSKPKFITNQSHGFGFSEGVDIILSH